MAATPCVRRNLPNVNFRLLKVVRQEATTLLCFRRPEKPAQFWRESYEKVHVFLFVATLLVSLGTLQAQQGSAIASSDSVSDQLRQLRDALTQQQQQISQQQQEIERLRQQVSAQQVSTTAGGGAPRVVDAALHTATAPAEMAAATVSDSPQEPTKEKESPISFRIGGADFTPGGFVDFSTFYRSVNLGSGFGTSFNTIPFNNTVADHLTEIRMTAQHSRLSLKMDSTFGDNKVTGYVETDFLGNNAANSFVTTNANTNRLRHYWLDLRHNKWEILGGQAYSWLTPNRTGLSPLPSDAFITLNVDPNYQVGLSWTRAAQFRVAYHPNEHWVFGVALENPQQYVGAGEVIFPFAINAQLGVQFDAANNPGTPNLHPDIIPKVAYDTDFMGGHHFHVEVAGLITSMKNTHILPSQITFHQTTSTGFGTEVATNVDVIKDRLKLIASGFVTDGGGRYIFGLGPDTVVRPNGDLALVHASSGVAGLEAKIFKNTQVAAYWGTAYFARQAFPDTTNPITIVPPQLLTCNNADLVIKPCGGFGGGNSPNSANRLLQEATFDLIQTIWKNKQYGALQVLTQYSWVNRDPWFVPLGAPKDAHMGMAYVNLRYIIP